MTTNKPVKRKAQVAYPDDFELLWSSYGRRGSKQEALREWKKLTTEEKDRAISMCPAYCAEQPELKYRLHLCRYLKRRVFDDVAERLQTRGIDGRQLDWRAPFTREHLIVAGRLTRDELKQLPPIVGQLADTAKRLATTLAYTTFALQAVRDELHELHVAHEDVEVIVENLRIRNTPHVD